MENVENDVVVDESTGSDEITSLEQLREVSDNFGNEPELTEEPVVEAAPEGEEDPVVETEEPLAYEPNFSYKVKNDEKMFDERLQGLIKDKETEDYIRDLYTKADGLDFYKNDLDSMTKNYGELEATSQAMVQGYQRLKELRDSGDMASLAKTLKLDRDAILDYASALLEEEELPQEQRALMQENSQFKEQLATMQTQIDQFQGSSEQAAVDRDLRELHGLATSESVSPVVEAMKERGMDFVKEVVDHGHMEFVTTGKEPTVRSAVDAIVNKYSYLNDFKQQQQQQQVEIEPPKTLPRVKGTNSNMVSKEITSLDELKALAAQIPT